jgi:serine phosphatase RsbU (regulator of sigma subunit)
MLAAVLMFILVSEPERLRIAIAKATQELEIAVQSLQNEILERKRAEEERHQAEIALRESEVKLAQSQAEINITRRLQQMLLPQDQELQAIPYLDIAGFMEPAAEVGGDYYDVLQQDGRVKIGIGDVTGHGLESGMLMMMVQMAVRTLLAHGESNPTHFLNTINLALYGNIQRMQVDRNVTLTLLDYTNGQVKITGQHEDVILVRADGRLERLDTFDLGFPIGIESDISLWTNEAIVDLTVGDLLILYTDGVTEAVNDDNEYYGIDRLCAIVIANRDHSALTIRQAILDSLYTHIGNHHIYDDITLLVIKQL